MSDLHGQWITSKCLYRSPTHNYILYSHRLSNLLSKYNRDIFQSLMNLASTEGASHKGVVGECQPPKHFEILIVLNSISIIQKEKFLSEMSLKLINCQFNAYSFFCMARLCLQVLSRSYSVGCLWHSHGKNPVRLYPKLQSQPIGLRKIFIDYFSFQVDQWDCTKPFRTFYCTNKLQSQPIGI